MFGCEDIFDKTDEYLDGELSEVEYALFEEHLAVCEECRKNVEFAKKLNGVVSGMPSVEPPSDFLETLHKKIAAEGKTVRFYKRWQPYGALAACVLVALVIRTNTVKDLNDSGAYLHSETPMPTTYSQMAQPEAEMSDTNAPIAADSADEVGNTEGNASVANVTESPLPRAAENDVSSEKSVEKTNDTSARDVAPMMSDAEKTTEKAAQTAVETQKKTAAPTAEVMRESKSENAAAVDVSGADESAPIVRGNSEADDVPMATGAAVQPYAAALPAENPVSESASESAPDKQMSSPSSGGGGASASTKTATVSALYAARQANVIDAVHKDSVLKIISELGIKENGGEYTATEQEYEKLVEKLSECGIEFDGVCTREENNVRFVIEWD